MSVFCDVCGQVGCYDHHLINEARNAARENADVIAGTRATLARIRAMDDHQRLRELEAWRDRIVAAVRRPKAPAEPEPPHVPVVLPEHGTGLTRPPGHPGMVGGRRRRRH